MKSRTISVFILYFIVFLPVAVSSSAQFEETILIDGGDAFRGLHPVIMADPQAPGLLHICYFNSYYDNESELRYSDLKYTTNLNGFEKSHWTVDIVENSDLTEGEGNYVSLAVDSAGRPHLFYYDPDETSLKYAFLDNSTWYRETIAEENAGSFVSATCDSSDNIQLCYYDEADSDLVYVYYDRNTWLKSTVDSEGDVGQHCSIDVDSENLPHIAYYDATNRDLKYAYFNGTEWLQETVDYKQDVGQYASLVITGSGLPAIAYYDSTFTALKYAFYNGTRWKTEYVADSVLDLISVLGSSTDEGTYCCLKIGSDDIARISYYSVTYGRIFFATRQGRSWYKELPYDKTFSGPYNSLEIDEDDKPYIGFFMSEERLVE